jgi:hypothetical protein
MRDRRESGAARRLHSKGRAPLGRFHIFGADNRRLGCWSIGGRLRDAVGGCSAQGMRACIGERAQHPPRRSCAGNGSRRNHRRRNYGGPPRAPHWCSRTLRGCLSVHLRPRHRRTAGARSRWQRLGGDQSADHTEGAHDKCCDADAMPTSGSARRSLCRRSRSCVCALDVGIEPEVREELILGVDAIRLTCNSTHQIEHHSRRAMSEVTRLGTHATEGRVGRSKASGRLRANGHRRAIVRLTDGRRPDRTAL